MKRLFKWLFSTESKSKKYKYEIILICYLILISIITYIISKLKTSEIENWINNATEPDTIYVKGIRENITIIEVSFETKGRTINEPWCNKQIWINDKEIKNANEIEEELYRTCLIKDDCICLMAITFYDDPKNFYKL